MQPNFTLKKLEFFCKLTPVLLILFCFSASKINAQCAWVSSPVVPAPVLDAPAVAVGSNLYIFGGVENGAIVATSRRFDGTTWTTIASVPAALEFSATCTDGTNAYILGGAITGTGVPQTTLYRYNVGTNTYTTLAPFTVGTWNSAAVLIGGRIYKFGGTGPATGSTTALEIYDIGTNTWSLGAAMPDPTSFPAAFSNGGFIYSIGGLNSTGTVASLKTYRYDPGTNIWNDAAIVDLPATRWGAAGGFYQGNGIIAGGYVSGTATANISTSTISWDPVGNSWTTQANMIGERARTTGAVLGGSFYVIGGRSIASAAFVGENSNQKLTCNFTACAGTPNPGNTLSSANPVCPTVNFTLSVATSQGIGSTYQWQSGPAVVGPWTNIALATGSTYTTNIAVATAYRCVVTCSNGGATAPSNGLLVTINPPSACYCVPVYTNGCTFGDYIANVSIGTLNNTTTCSTPPFTYYNLVPAPTLFLGQTLPLSITVGPDGFGQRCAAWIDFNQNGSFNDPGEFIGATGDAGPNGTVTLSVNIPAGATVGTTRMRVRGGDDNPTSPTAGQSCGPTASTFGEAEDYNVNIQPCIPIVITGSPSSSSVTCGGNASFTVTNTGSAPIYSWEYRTSAVGVWLTVPNAAPYSGVNTATLTITNATQPYNGYQFRALVSGACAAVDFSAAATLTVTPIIPVVTPASATICTGTVQQLSLTNTLGNADLITEGFNTVIPAGWSVQNLSSPVGTTSWFQGDNTVFPAQSGAANSYAAANFNNTGLVGQISTWLFTPQVAIKNGDVFKFWSRKVAPDAFADRMQVRMSTNGASTNVGATALSVGDFTTLLLDINPTEVLGVYPIVWTQYTLTVSGLGAPTSGRFAFRNFISNAGGNAPNGDYIGVDNVVFTSSGGPAQGTWTGPAGTMWNNAAANIPYTGTLATTIWVNPTVSSNYQVSFTTLSPCTSAITTVPITVVNPVTAVVSPTNKTVCVGGSTSYSVSASGGPITYQWQVSVDGGVTYTNISGATAATLNVSGITQLMNNNRYRCVLTAAPCGSVTSGFATLTVNPLPTVVISSVDLSITPGQFTTINATSTPAAAPAGWSWTLNGSSLSPAVTGNTVTVGIDAIGTYRATVTDVNGCVNSSNNLTIGAEASERLWIYPNPNNGTFQIRLYYPGSIAERRVVRIYNVEGQLVAQKEFDLVLGTPSYMRMDFELPRLAAGTYAAKVSNKFNKVIVSGLFVIQK